MALAAIQRTFNQTVGVGASVTTVAITTTPGNLLIVCVAANANSIPASPITDSKGNTWLTAIASVGVTHGWSAMFYVPNCLGGAGHTFTFTPSFNDFIAISVLEISGASTTPLSNTNSSTTSTSTHSSGNITANALVPEIFVGDVSMSLTNENPIKVTGIQWPFSYNTAGATTEGIVTGHRIVDPGTTDSFNVTMGVGSNEAILIAGFKSATAAPSGGGGSSVLLG